MVIQDKHIYKQVNGNSKKLYKKVAFILAVFTFIGAIIVAAYYKNFISRPESNLTVTQAELTQFNTDDEFKTFIVLPLLNNAVEEITSIDIKLPPTIPKYSQINKSKLYFSDINNKKTNILDISRPENPILLKTLNHFGELFLIANNLVIVEQNQITAFDTETYLENWKIDFKANKIVTTYSDGARIYTAIEHKLSNQPKCPLDFATQNNISITTPCSSIFYPINSDNNFSSVLTIININPQNGGIDNRISLVKNTKTHISLNNNIFVSYEFNLSSPAVLYAFLIQNAIDILPANLITKIQKIESMELSEEAKLVELNNSIKMYLTTLSIDQRSQFVQNISNKLGASPSPSSSKSQIFLINRLNLSPDKGVTIDGALESDMSFVENASNLVAVANLKTTDFYSDSLFLKFSTDLTNAKQSLLKGVSHSLKPVSDNGFIIYSEDATYIITNEGDKLSDLEAESLVLPLDNTRAIQISGNTASSVISIVDLTQNQKKLAFSVNEPIDDLISHIHTFSVDTNRNLFTISSSDRTYIFTYDANNLGIFRIFSSKDVVQSIFDQNHLYAVSSEEFTAVNTNTKIIFSSILQN